jgi:hypothetical protein
MWQASRSATKLQYRDSFKLKLAMQIALLGGAFALAWFAPSGSVLLCQQSACTLVRESPLGHSVSGERFLANDLREATLEQAPFVAGRAVQPIAQRIVLEGSGWQVPFTIHHSNRRWELQDIAVQINRHVAAPSGVLQLRYDDHRPALFIAALLAALGLYGLVWGAVETRVVADRQARTLTVSFRRLLFTTGQTVDVSRIERLLLEATHHSKQKRPHYRPVMVLSDGQRVPLSRHSSAYREAHAGMLEELSRFAGLPFERYTQPSQQDAPEAR